MRHNWTESDENCLRAAVEVVSKSGGEGLVRGRVLLWHAVAGIMLRDGVVVSADACRKRWGILEERETERLAAEAVRLEAEAHAEMLANSFPPAEPRVVVEPDAWESLSRKIAAWEMESADELTSALRGLRSDVGELDLRVRTWEGRLVRIEACVGALVDVWGVKL